MSTPPHPHGLRPARDADADALRTLVFGCYAEYPGAVPDPDGEDADLAAPASTFASRRGALWVVEQAGALVACGGWAPADRATAGAAAEVKRVYVAAGARRRGLASGLVARAEDAARAAGCTDVVAWSDTRFHDAHALYAGLGYRRTERTRALHDPSHTTEYQFLKDL